MFQKKQKTSSQPAEPPKPEKLRSCPMCRNPYTVPWGVVNKYQFRRCHRCLFVFCPQITPEYLAMLYAEGYHGREPEEGTPKVDWSDPSFLDPAFDLLPGEQKLQILAFGSGQSLVPDKLRAQGHHVVAVNISPASLPHPNSSIGDLSELQLEPDQFDLLYSFEAFECLPQPRPLLDELLRLTKPGGLVLIHTHMETPEREEEGFENWWYVAPPDHCVFFRHKTFEVYLEDKPHQIVWKDPRQVIIHKGAS